MKMEDNNYGIVHCGYIDSNERYQAGPNDRQLDTSPCGGSLNYNWGEGETASGCEISVSPPREFILTREENNKVSSPTMSEGGTGLPPQVSGKQDVYGDIDHLHPIGVDRNKERCADGSTGISNQPDYGIIQARNTSVIGSFAPGDYYMNSLSSTELHKIQVVRHIRYGHHPYSTDEINKIVAIGVVVRELLSRCEEVDSNLPLAVIRMVARNVGRCQYFIHEGVNVHHAPEMCYEYPAQVIYEIIHVGNYVSMHSNRRGTHNGDIRQRFVRLYRNTFNFVNDGNEVLGKCQDYVGVVDVSYFMDFMFCHVDKFQILLRKSREREGVDPIMDVSFGYMVVLRYIVHEMVNHIRTGRNLRHMVRKLVNDLRTTTVWYMVDGVPVSQLHFNTGYSRYTLTESIDSKFVSIFRLFGACFYTMQCYKYVQRTIDVHTHDVTGRNHHLRTQMNMITLSELIHLPQPMGPCMSLTVDCNDSKWEYCYDTAPMVSTRKRELSRSEELYIVDIFASPRATGPEYSSDEAGDGPPKRQNGSGKSDRSSNKVVTSRQTLMTGEKRRKVSPAITSEKAVERIERILETPPDKAQVNRRENYVKCESGVECTMFLQSTHFHPTRALTKTNGSNNSDAAARRVMNKMIKDDKICYTSCDKMLLKCAFDHYHQRHTANNRSPVNTESQNVEQQPTDIVKEVEVNDVIDYNVDNNDIDSSYLKHEQREIDTITLPNEFIHDQPTSSRIALDEPLQEMESEEQLPLSPPIAPRENHESDHVSNLADHQQHEGSHSMELERLGSRQHISGEVIQLPCHRDIVNRERRNIIVYTKIPVGTSWLEFRQRCWYSVFGMNFNRGLHGGDNVRLNVDGFNDDGSCFMSWLFNGGEGLRERDRKSVV